MLINIFKKSTELHPMLYIAIVWIISCAIMIIAYPQLLIDQQISHIRFLDTERVYMGSFTFLSNIFHGGIQLWNTYDQMPLMFSYMIGDTLSLNNLFVSLGFLVVSPFFDSPAEAFHVVASIVPVFVIILFQSIGFFLLLKRFSARLTVLLPCIIIGNTLLSPHILSGLTISATYALFPLLIHFILRFFEHFSVNDALLAFLVMLITVGTNPYTSLGYLYQSVHYFILCGIVWVVVIKYSDMNKTFFRKKWRISSITLLKIGSVLLIFVIIMMPLIILIYSNYGDYEFGHQGSRMQSAFSFTKYFTNPVVPAYKMNFPLHSLDFGNNNFALSWQFIGFSTLFFSCCGLVLSGDSRKFVFFGAVLFIWLMNGDRAMNISVIAHFINAVTNPLAFLVRSYHMGVFTLQFFLLPLIVIGLESIISLVEKSSASTHS